MKHLKHLKFWLSVALTALVPVLLIYTGMAQGIESIRYGVIVLIVLHMQQTTK